MKQSKKQLLEELARVDAEMRRTRDLIEQLKARGEELLELHKELIKKIEEAE